ncbi:hypothetical protein [Catenuloplanes atrovinosus]|uniref:DUF6311 domain-containing protein n=1 Tax=Catenuloplanes atrovinosus TaxID=137266 RepID=A0AAE4CC91_9ACTN|nr:hypothetical protein [Catenuloplanes atrovinosus]MDR7279401.1 hypothetical protein [Catenuloplanes atrovinosus]
MVAIGKHKPDLAALTAYLLIALVLTLPLWRDLDRAVPEANEGDHAFFEYVLARAAALVTGDARDPFVTDELNVPLGVNLMANTSVLGVGLPLVPVTLLAGPAASFALLVLLGLALTAYGWFWVFRRRLAVSPLAAGVGGAFCGFAPGVVTHAQGHPNWTAQFLLPFVVHLLFDPRRRSGPLLGLVMAWQVFINEEALFFTGLGCAVFGLLHLALRPREADRTRFLTNLGVALAVAGALVGYPLWVQFTGPGSYRGVPEFVTSYGNDVAAFVSFSHHSLAGPISPFGQIAPNETEENAFFGFPLVIAFVVLAVVLRARAAALAAAVTAVVFAVLSVGRDVIVNGYGDVSRPGPWEPFAHLPIFDSVVPTRLSLIAIPCVGLLLALAVDRSRPAVALVAAALVPIVPMPVSTTRLAPVPAYITTQGYREQLADGGSMLVTPRIWTDTTGMRWAARAGLDFPLALGYFLGPDPDPTAGGRALFGPPRRPTHALIVSVSTTGYLPPLTVGDRAAFASDLAYWRTSVIVLPNDQPHRAAVESLLTSLTGRPPTRTGGVSVWDL